jgi:hypothetical protein
MMANLSCPICERKRTGTAQWRDFPFCSSRCRQIDLGRWLGENYSFQPDEEPVASELADDDESRVP